MKISDRIKELTAMGEFKTFGEAKEYCRLHGLDASHIGNNAFQIAGALMDARKDQDKITRHACAENVNMVSPAEDEDNLDFCSGWEQAIDVVHDTIINTKAI